MNELVTVGVIARDFQRLVESSDGQYYFSKGGLDVLGGKENLTKIVSDRQNTIDGELLPTVQVISENKALNRVQRKIVLTPGSNRTGQ
jgi:hypothetical protein